LRQLLFAFLLGAVVGGFGSLVAVGPQDGSALETPSIPPTPIVKAEPAMAPHVPNPKLDANADNLKLAKSLDQARFSGDWARVTEVGHVLRGRSGPGRTASPARLPPGGEASLILVSHEYRRRAFELELRGRENTATEIAAADLEVPEKAQRLRGLVLAPLLQPNDRAVRADAAFLLADMRLEAGRVALLRAVQDPDTELADLAAEALCRANDQLALEALQGILRSDLDPVLRRRLVSAFPLSSATVAGGGPAVALAASARSDRDVSVRTAALESLARVDLEACPDALEVMVAITEDDAEDIRVRRACVKTLREHRKVAKNLPGQLVVALERTLSKATGPLRLDVIAALGEVGRAESLAALESARLGAKAPAEAQALQVALDALKTRTQER
jgi:HEAT repeat protein